MIEAAVIISAIIGRWEDFGIIFALLIINAVVGFWQEYQAGERHRHAQRAART